jgi:SAM-dependent methyltransferase
MPSDEELSEVYDQGQYYTTLSPKISNSIRTRIEAKILQVFWGFPNTMSKTRILIIRFILSPFKNRFLAFNYSAGNKIIDIGCGNGQRLLELEQLGCQNLYGLETTTEAARQARSSTKAKVFECALQQIPVPDHYFDTVILNQVLEHVRSPKDMLSSIRRILKSDGEFYLTVPNIDSFESRLFGNNWAGLRVPEHLHHFTPDSLKSLMIQSGFRITMLRTDTSLSVTLESYLNRKFKQKEAIPPKPVSLAVKMLLAALAFTADVSGYGQMIRVRASKELVLNNA